MEFIQKVINFLRNILIKLFRVKPVTDKEVQPDSEGEQQVQPQTEQGSETSVEKIANQWMDIATDGMRSSMLSRLYALEQEIAVFQQDFPEDYEDFGKRIEEQRQECCLSLQEIQKELTFAIDPDTDLAKKNEVDKLEKDIRYFIETKVKFKIFAHRLQGLIVKLNILYNVSIAHSKKKDIQKAISQLEHAQETEMAIAHELKESEYVLQDKQLSGRLLELLSYADYLIFKANMRISKQTPEELVRKLAMVAEFKDFDYVQSFKCFVKDELYDLGSLLAQIPTEGYRKILKESGGKLLLSLTNTSNIEAVLLDIVFWGEFLDYESTLLEMMKVSGANQDECQVKLIARMNIKVEADDVLVAPVTNAYLSLTHVFYATRDKRVLLLMKMLGGMSKEVTYKEIYFLALLFDTLEVIQSIPNELTRFMRKYQEKYHYEKSTIADRKKSVMALPNKEYVIVFSLDEYKQQILDTLTKLDIDFQVLEEKVLINSFYFNGLDNVLATLRSNA